MRLYINFFQPSLKLLSKERSGARVTKKYSPAKTPYQRLISSGHVEAQMRISDENDHLFRLKLITFGELPKYVITLSKTVITFNRNPLPSIDSIGF